MRLETDTGPPERIETPLLVVFAPSDRPLTELVPLSRLTGGVLSHAISSGDFQGRRRDRFLAYRREAKRGPERILFLGIGPSDALTEARLREAAGRAVREAERFHLPSLALCLGYLGREVAPRWIEAVAEGMVLASWRYDELRSRMDSDSRPEERPPPVEMGVVVAPPDAELAHRVRIGHAFANAENRARTLQARPGNLANPSQLAAEAVRIAGEAGLDLEVLGPDDMESQAMGALLAVAQGSDEEPRLIVLSHRGGEAGAPPVVLVGKGLTFDAGGISIKPAKGMEEMKYDMSGGAAVLSAMLAVGRLGINLNVLALVPCSENLLNGSATKPGDVVFSRAGKSIEVINTDAEGRLILADALHYATDWNPVAIVDCATLTGACVVALGHHRSAVLGNDDGLVAELRAAGDRADQPCWPLPLDNAYRRQLDSTVADLRNVGGRPAGTITAACFLSEFVGDVPWAHLDIAGTAYGKTTKSYLRDGPNGSPCRLLLEWVRARAGF